MKKEEQTEQKARQQRRSKWMFIAVFVAVMAIFAGVRHIFAINVPLHIPTQETLKSPETLNTSLLPTNSSETSDSALIIHKQNGINPVNTRTEAEALIAQHQLVNITNSPFYAIDDLTHSIPYLVPRAQQLLNTISLNFIDSCQVKGVPLHLPIVTSVLRTTEDVSSLQRGNKNATTNSCHCYGTTVDIAYNKFMPLTGSYNPRTPLSRWDEPLKQILSEVLRDLREQEKCYVKYERKQGCFHLTCR